MKIKICVITSSRADYGILKNLIFKFSSSKFVNFKLIVTGSHLSSKYGCTVKEIISDGIKIDTEVPIIKNTDTNQDIANIFSKAVKNLVVPISKINPDIVLLLGDRYETLASAIATTILKKPIAHIHGGEITEGAMDNAMRHCITKLSHIHFVSNEIYKTRVIQMGEMPKNVYNVGALGVEDLHELKLMSLKKLEKEINFKLLKKNILITYHPVTLDKNPIKGINHLLKALTKFNNVGLIFTLSNADIKSEIINEKILKFVKLNSNAVAFQSLGKVKYFSCLNFCDLIVGNSSSGIIEAPTLRKCSINIGNRQEGRLKAKSVFDVKIDEKEIKGSIYNLLYGKIETLNINFNNPYFKKDTKDNILKILTKINCTKLIEKKFYDIGYKV